MRGGAACARGHHEGGCRPFEMQAGGGLQRKRQALSPVFRREVGGDPAGLCHAAVNTGIGGWRRDPAVHQLAAIEIALPADRFQFTGREPLGLG